MNFEKLSEISLKLFILFPVQSAKYHQVYRFLHSIRYLCHIFLIDLQIYGQPWTLYKLNSTRSEHFTLSPRFSLNSFNTPSIFSSTVSAEVYYYASRNAIISFPIASGDQCVFIFNIFPGYLSFHLIFLWKKSNIAWLWLRWKNLLYLGYDLIFTRPNVLWRFIFGVLCYIVL